MIRICRIKFHSLTIPNVRRTLWKIAGGSKEFESFLYFCLKSSIFITCEGVQKRLENPVQGQPQELSLRGVDREGWLCLRAALARGYQHSTPSVLSD